MSMDGSASDIRSLELLLERLGPGSDPVEQQALRELEQTIAMRRVMQEGRIKKRNQGCRT
jgi:hypothetical protein